MRTLGRAAMLSAAIAAMGAIPVAAQTVTFSTSGTFSGTGCSATACNFGGFVLSFAGQPSTSYLAPTFVDLGSFTTLCSGCSSQTTAIGSGAMFTLTITQTNPTSGTTSFVGSVTGTLSFNPTGSSLIWTPTTFTAGIGSASYALVTDAGAGLAGKINISAPTDGGTTVNTTSVKAFVTVPEPASVALVATGLLGLIPVARRRRNN